jgi:hypothetical protein
MTEEKKYCAVECRSVCSQQGDKHELEPAELFLWRRHRQTDRQTDRCFSQRGAKDCQWQLLVFFLSRYLNSSSWQLLTQRIREGQRFDVDDHATISRKTLMCNRMNGRICSNQLCTSIEDFRLTCLSCTLDYLFSFEDRSGVIDFREKKDAVQVQF